MTLQQHIDELRAELEWNEDPAEIRQIKAELEEAKALQLPRYQQQPEDLAEQSPRMERLLVWLHLARSVLELPEVDRLYGELAKLHELARQPIDEQALEMRVEQAHLVWTLKAWKQLEK